MIYLITGILLFGCEKINSDNLEIIDFVQIELDCINKASGGGTLSVRIDTQEEYDTFYYYRYTKPLNDWLNDNYSSLIDGVIINYPNATPNEYDSIIINDYMYNFAPYKWVKDCTNPSIDFNNYTLLGQSIAVCSCSTPKLKTEIYLDSINKELTFLVNVESYGSCEMEFCFYEWILVDKLSDDYEIIFKSEKNNFK